MRTIKKPPRAATGEAGVGHDAASVCIHSNNTKFTPTCQTLGPLQHARRLSDAIAEAARAGDLDARRRLLLQQGRALIAAERGRP